MARLFDLHIHTTKGSSDSSLTPEDMILEADRLGLRGRLVGHEGRPVSEWRPSLRHRRIGVSRQAAGDFEAEEDASLPRSHGESAEGQAPLPLPGGG